MPRALRQLSLEAPPATTPAPEKAKPEPLYGLVPNAGPLLGLIGILIAFGHSFLAMSGEESLAQVNRELEYPKGPRNNNLPLIGLTPTYGATQ
jgi:hypothetical protein